MTELELPIWAGFDRSNGIVEIGRDDGPERPFGPEQEAAIAFSIAHAAQMQSLLLDAITAAYPTLRDEFEEGLPETLDRDAFRRLTYLQALTIHSTARDGLAYVGYTFHAREADLAFVSGIAKLAAARER